MNQTAKYLGIGLAIAAAIALVVSGGLWLSMERTASLDREAGVVSSPMTDLLAWAWNLLTGGATLSVASVVAFIIGWLRTNKLPFLPERIGGVEVDKTLRQTIDVGEIGLYVYLVKHTTSAEELERVTLAARTAWGKLGDTLFPLPPIPMPVVVHVPQVVPVV